MKNASLQFFFILWTWNSTIQFEEITHISRWNVIKIKVYKITFFPRIFELRKGKTCIYKFNFVFALFYAVIERLYWEKLVHFFIPTEL